MRTSDLLLLVVLALWWLKFRKQYDWKSVLLFYMGGVFVADLLGAVFILMFYNRHPDIIRIGAYWMPVGGLLGLYYARKRGYLKKLSENDDKASSD